MWPQWRHGCRIAIPICTNAFYHLVVEKGQGLDLPIAKLRVKRRMTDLAKERPAFDGFPDF